MKLSTPRCSTLKLAKLAPSSLLSHRSFATTSPSSSDAAHPVTDVAILGGGLTGLTSAFYAAEKFPTAKITVFESSDRFGGWIRSSKLDVQGSHVIFEQGPKSVRHTDKSIVILDLIRRLGLTKDLLLEPRISTASNIRSLYYPDRLVVLPAIGSLVQQLRYAASAIVTRQPLYRGLFLSVLLKSFAQLFRSRPRNAGDVQASMQDESIASFFNSRVSSKLTDRFISAIIHGIYAGDVDNLSVSTTFPFLKFLDAKHGSIINGYLWQLFHQRAYIPMSMSLTYDDLQLRDESWDALSSMMKDTSTYSLEGGLEKLPRTLIQRLRANRNISLCLKSTVTKITKSRQDQKLTAQVDSQEKYKNITKSQSFSHVISTISGSKLMSLCSPSLDKSQLDQTPAVTVMVVNLFYLEPNLIQWPGFGYLIPRAVPFEKNPNLALGVVFDSHASIRLDSTAGTKLTVMLGGHYWDGWTSYPTKQEGEKMAMDVVASHLRIRQRPYAVKVSLNQDCIPQYTVGHPERMHAAHEALLSAYDGRVRVAGSWFTGVALGDCARSGFEVIMGLKRGKKASGLERIMPFGEIYAPMPLAQLKKAAEKKKKPSA